MKEAVEEQEARGVASRRERAGGCCWRRGVAEMEVREEDLEREGGRATMGLESMDEGAEVGGAEGAAVRARMASIFS